MKPQERKVSTASELLAAVEDGGTNDIVVLNNMEALQTFRLLPGQILRGAQPYTRLHFATGQDGIQLSSGNTVEGLELTTDLERRALFNDTTMEQLGRLILRNLRTTGSVRILANNKVRGGHVEVDALNIIAADARHFNERPQGYGVEVIPGVFTLWNQHSERDVTITAELRGLTTGRAGAPTFGSGIFVCGGGDNGGRLIVRRLTTGEIHSHGGISEGTPDRISGGVFVVHGAWVDEVRSTGPVTTYGPNDMVLDNWGTVEHWQADAKVTSYGPSAIGFVNFGTIGKLQVAGVIETFGLGARGFNVYTGTVRDAEFERIVTQADGAVGVQLSQPIGRLAIRHGIETYGGVGNSLVKGVVMPLPATAFSIKPGGSAREVVISGGLVTHGAGIEPIEMHGTVDSFTVSGPFGPAGAGFAGI